MFLIVSLSFQWNSLLNGVWLVMTALIEAETHHGNCEAMAKNIIPTAAKFHLTSVVGLMNFLLFVNGYKF